MENELLAIKIQRTPEVPAVIMNALQQTRQSAPSYKTPVLVLQADTGQSLAVLSLPDLMYLLEHLPRTLLLPLAHPRWQLEMQEIDPDWGMTEADREWLRVCCPDQPDW